MVLGKSVGWLVDWLMGGIVKWTWQPKPKRL